MSNLKELISQALDQQQGQGGGHISAMRALLAKIEREHGREVIRQLRPAGFKMIFAAVHPDLVGKVGNSHEFACQLNAFKNSRGFQYDKINKIWIDTRAK